MSRQTAQLLAAFEALPEEEKRHFMVEFCVGRCRSIPVRWTGKRPWLRISSLAALTLMKMMPRRGQVWLFDLGMAGKVRPARVVSVGYGDVNRALITILPQHTTSLRGSQHQVAVDVPFLKAGAFLVQNVATYPNIKAIRKFGTLRPHQFDLVFAGLLRWLGDVRV